MNNLEIEPNEFLEKKIIAYYHGYHRGWRDTQVNYINTLKNDDGTFGDHKKDFGYTLSDAQRKLLQVLQGDLPIIASTVPKKLTICVMPRAKCNNKYQPTQLLFLNTIKKFAANNVNLFNDGTAYITRIKDTPTTHIGNNYSSVNVGITNRTCDISDDVIGKDILLIDDIYTKSVNIDEDAIQALYDKGANSVIFYALGRTE